MARWKGFAWSNTQRETGRALHVWRGTELALMSPPRSWALPRRAFILVRESAKPFVLVGPSSDYLNGRVWPGSLARGWC
jgi:hypothetical protein